LPLKCKGPVGIQGEMPGIKTNPIDYNDIW
jgi:hypothetical protein